ncbi:hypothetical protein FBQ82_21295 [Anaerolineae bacterium CFX7]|nr:hypothetical protein [Anaerolineae bacterium CFX7]
MRKILLGVVLLGGVACGNLPGVAAAPAFQIENANPDDTIAYTASAKQVVFDVTSPRGIGKAHILQTAGAAPEKITLRLHLRALEHFKFSFDAQAVEIEIPSAAADPTPRVSAPPDSPLYMPVEIISQAKTYPLQTGYIQIELPRAYYQANARAFTIEWIDFYR